MVLVRLQASLPASLSSRVVTSPQMGVTSAPPPSDDETSQYQKGVKHLVDNGINKLPTKYILPVQDRPNMVVGAQASPTNVNLRLPVIDFVELQGPGRSRTLRSIADACEYYGFFQVINHEIPIKLINSMIDVRMRFFNLPYEERAKYMSSNMFNPVRYATSMNQKKDKVFCWRDFLKLTCHPISDILPYWPSTPADLRKLADAYAKETKILFLTLMEAILEGLGLKPTLKNVMQTFEEGNHLMVLNCYPPCPEPDLTLGVHPHSDHGFLTLLLQDEVEGLQIQLEERWVTVEPIPNSFIVNVGDHLEIFSNGNYKSILHRVLANPVRPRISVASFHTVPHECMVRPSPELVNEANPPQYKDTDFASFLEYASS